MENSDRVDFFPFLYTELLSQLAGPYGSVLQVLWTKPGEISEQTNKLISLFLSLSHSLSLSSAVSLSLLLAQRIKSGDLTFDSIRTSLHLLKHRSIHLSLEIDARLEGPPRFAMDSKIDILTDNHGPSNSSTNLRLSSATYHTARFRTLPFPNTPFTTISPPSIGEGGAFRPCY